MHRHASLNRIYRLVWSHVQRAWVAVAENARGQGKRASRSLLLATAALSASSLAHASPRYNTDPIGASVVSGRGNVNLANNTTTITQNSALLSLSWSSFDTLEGHTVNFVQPSSSAIAINRITDSNSTYFAGKLTANGQVYLINPNGVVFGESAQVNVGGLIASTLDIADAKAAGAQRRFGGDNSGAVHNYGTITSAGGYVAFIGNTISNVGVINAPDVALAAGTDVTLSFDSNRLLALQINRSALYNGVDNSGMIFSTDGRVLLSAGARDNVLESVVNNSGRIQAMRTINQNGTIILEGGSNSSVTNDGTISTSNSTAGIQAGDITLLGNTLALSDTSQIYASGNAGGGTILIGGSALGAGLEQPAP